MDKIKDHCHFNKQEVCKGRFCCYEVAVRGEAADFASKAHYTSLPKSKWLQEAWQDHPCVVGRKCFLQEGSRLHWGCLAGAQRKQWAGVCGVECGWPYAHTVLAFHLGPLFTASSGIFWPTVLSSAVPTSRTLPLKVDIQLLIAFHSILSTTSLAFSFQANIVSFQHHFPSCLPPRTCFSHFPSTPLKWRGKTWYAVNEVKRGCKTETDKRKKIRTHK